MSKIRAVAVLLLLVFLFTPLQASDWTLVKHGGRDYVTASNIASFYNLGKVEREGNTFRIGNGSRRLRGQVGGAEFYINALKFILSYPAAEQNGEPMISRMDLVKLVEPVLRPSKIRNAEPIRTVILDAGHGGHDKGARSIYGNEKDYTLDVVRRCKAILEQQGYKVYLSRSGDYFVSLDDRSAFANQFSNAMFISVHFNSGQSLASGLEVFTLAPRGVPSMASDGPRMSDLVECKGNKRDAENMALATATHAAMVGRSRLFDRGIKRARFVVIRDIGIPGVLIEGGFLSNSHDAKLIASAQYRQLMAFSIAMAVNNYQRATTANPPPFLAKAPQVQLRDESGAEIQPPANGEGSEASPTPEASPEPTVEHAAPAVIPPPESTTEQPQPNDTPKPEA